MKDGFVQEGTKGALLPDELEEINRYSVRKLAEDEVYTFSLILCDNEIDRDFERFSVEALEKLCRLFVGKTGIFDHSFKGSDQTARIYRCEVVRDPGKKTAAGEDYVCLKAKAYMPRTEKNADLIKEIEAGIKKEISISCAVEEAICSVCGVNVKKVRCAHKKGKRYGGKVCHVVLNSPTDAYEWSFVAVPAQPRAGVVKAFNIDKERGEARVNEVLKTLKMAGEEVTLSGHQAEEILKYLERLEMEAEAGRAYIEGLKKEVVRLAGIVWPKLSHSAVVSLAEKMDIEELRAFKAAFEAAQDEVMPPMPQLAKAAAAKEAGENKQFKI